MPPRATSARGGRGGARGGRGAGPPRGGGSDLLAFGLPSAGSHITTVGVKRPNFGTGGRELPIFVNSFVTTIPEGVIHHYDGKLERMVEICDLTIFLVGLYILGA
jgi:eukaryotic translation initiation factor 2C